MKKLTKKEKQNSMKGNKIFRIKLKRLFNDCNMFEKKPARIVRSGQTLIDG